MQATTALNAALSGRYLIERELGTGGMATVFLAHDQRHDRRVAIKVLKPELAAVLGAERFIVEIKTTASLQHPHILPLFDSGEADGFLYYVMPYIQGETVREKLNRETQFGVDDAVRIAREVADALDYAHRQGVIHRDIKPENILLHDGRAMVMDFGIALALSAAAGGRMTETGLSLGTPHYMSPEQATAEKEITARSDVYSLGSVLFEMLTGNPPHTGASAQQVIMKIITEPAEPVTKYRKLVPANVAAAVAKAVEKLPADRFENARAFADVLGNPSYVGALPSAASTALAPAAARRRIARDFAWLAAGAAIATAAFLATRRAQPPAPVPARFSVELPDSATLSAVTYGVVALSRDGSRLAVVCNRPAVAGALCLRNLRDPAGQVVAGTQGATSATFSPLGDWLLFTSGGVLRKVPASGGTPQKLAESAREASWGDDGIIVYVAAAQAAAGDLRRAGLWRVASDGSDRRRVVSGESAGGILLQPEILPGSRSVLVSRWRLSNIGDSARLAIVSLANGAVTDLGVYGISPHYVAPGYIVFAQSGGRVVAAPFSLSRRAITGPVVPVVEGVRTTVGAAFGVAQNGTIAFVSGEAEAPQTMYVVDRQGRERALKGSMELFKEPRISPDGQRIAVRLGRGPTQGGLWIYDIGPGTLSRLTPDSESIRGEWTRDGTHVVYVNHATADTEVVVSAPWDKSSAPRVLARGGPFSFYQLALGPANGWSAVRRGGSVSSEILLAPTESLSAVRPFIKGSPAVLAPRVSASGRLLAYASNEAESQRFEVYVRPIPGPGRVVQVSVDGGTEPIWSADGTTLFYRGPKRLMAATVLERPTLAVTRRDSLFVDTYRRYAQHSAYDVFPNGREFVMTRGPAVSAQLQIIVNWPEFVGKLAAHTDH